MLLEWKKQQLMKYKIGILGMKYMQRNNYQCNGLVIANNTTNLLTI